MLVAAELCLTATAATFAASPQMGTWKLNESKSKFEPESGKNHTVTHAAAKGDMMKVTVDGMDKDGKAVHWTWTGKFDGQPHKVKGSAMTDSISYKPVNELTTMKDGKVVMTGTITVSKDGKSRLVETTTTDSKGKNTPTRLTTASSNTGLLPGKSKGGCFWRGRRTFSVPALIQNLGARRNSVRLTKGAHGQKGLADPNETVKRDGIHIAVYIHHPRALLAQGTNSRGWQLSR